MWRLIRQHGLRLAGAGLAGWRVFADAAPTSALPFEQAYRDWAVGSYELTVFHRGPLEAQEVDSVNSLANSSKAQAVNLVVTTVDILEPMSEPAQTLWEGQINAEPPWV